MKNEAAGGGMKNEAAGGGMKNEAAGGGMKNEAAGGGMKNEAAMDADDILGQAAAWRRAGHGVAIATVVETWGSAPRPVGSQLAVEAGGRFAGSVSAGCVEGAVVDAALRVIEGGQPTLLEFGVSNETAWSVGLPCGGRIAVFVEPLE